MVPTPRTYIGFRWKITSQALKAFPELWTLVDRFRPFGIGNEMRCGNHDVMQVSYSLESPRATRITKFVNPMDVMSRLGCKYYLVDQYRHLHLIPYESFEYQGLDTIDHHWYMFKAGGYNQL